jgi:hypothetical protein
LLALTAVAMLVFADRRDRFHARADALDPSGGDVRV